MHSHVFAVLALTGSLTACDLYASEHWCPPADNQCYVDPPATGVHDVPCNGFASLCDRRYDEVAHATLHNAMSSSAYHFFQPNQDISIETALMLDRVRALMLDVHYHRGEPFLCHSLCELGRIALKPKLYWMRRFLDTHPGEVLTLILENYVDPADLDEALVETRLGRYALPAPSGAWPTLGEMVSSNRRAVIFTEQDYGDSFPRLIPFYRYARETVLPGDTPSTMSCALGRGQPENRLFLLNHFLTKVFSNGGGEVNTTSLLVDRVLHCGAYPNFIAVDAFWSAGTELDIGVPLDGPYQYAASTMVSDRLNGIVDTSPPAALPPLNEAVEDTEAALRRLDGLAP